MLQQKLKYKTDLIKNYSTEAAIIIRNEGKLHQAFLNFLSNSEQAIEEWGKVTIESKVNKEGVSISIADTGIGISQENIKKISHAYFTTKPEGKGTGLELTITC